MRRCKKCEKGKRAGAQRYEIELGRRTFEGEVRGWRCRVCGERYHDGPDLEHFDQLVARWLAENGFETGAEFKFMRKAAGIRAADLAEWMGVTPETVSHWETGKHPSDVTTRALLAAIVLDALGGKTATRDRLDAQRSPARRKRIRVAA